MESKIYLVPDDELGERYTFFVINVIEKHFKNISHVFKDDVDLDFFNENYTDNSSFIAVEFADNIIFPRFCTKNGDSLNIESRILDDKFKEKFKNKNILELFDQFSGIDITSNDETWFEPEYTQEFNDLRFVDIHLNKNDALRGAASIMDTGLFDFKSTH